MRGTRWLIGLALALSGGLGLAPRATGQEPPPRPKPPLEVVTPVAPPFQYDQHDLRKLDAETLRENAWAAYENNDFFVGVQFQHWAVQKDGEGRYNLACFHARTGALEAAIYWLQQAALEEGVDAAWAKEDQDLQDVRRDPRWEKLHAFFLEASEWWANSGRKETLLLLPQGYQPGTPLGALVGLHGRGSRPQDFADPEDWQHHADRLGIAIVGVSATRPTGPHGYVWAGEPAADFARLQAALEELAPRVGLDPARTVLIGFSQGAQVALEQAARHPELFAGAIALSPGGTCRLQELEPSEALAERGFVISVGAHEDESFVALAAQDRDQLKRLGARVQHLVPAQEAHAFPQDLADRLGEWHQFASLRKP